ncbi:MAG: efflux RND transporter permease subunit [Caldilineaceae bacterium]
MIRWLVESSLRLRFLVVVVTLVLVAYGFSELRKMPIDIYPEFNPPLVEVQTEALGLSAAEVESLITTPMEADLLNGAAWVEHLYSESVAGLSRILLLFEPGTDLTKARQMVQERLTQAYALPNVSKPPAMLQPLSSTNRVMMIGLTPKDGALSLIDLSVLAHWNIKPRLMGVPGVANVAIWGQRDQQLQIQVDPKVLQAKDVTLSEVIETSGEALWVSPLSYLESSSPGTAGWIDTPNQRLSIRHILPIISPEDLAKVPIVDKTDLLLGDVANIVTDNQPLIGDAILNNGSGLLLVVEKFPAAHTLEVTQALQEAIDAMRPGLSGIEIDDTVFRPAGYIELALGNLNRTLLIGVILMAFSLLILFMNWRQAVVSFVTIVVSLILATYLLYVRGVPTLNMMVLAGLVLALVVIIDDAIIDVDNIALRLRQQRQAGISKSGFDTALDAVLEMRGAVFFATLAILLSVMPLYFMEGLSGSFLQPLIVAYFWALVTSLLVGMIVAHGLGLLLLDDAKEPARHVQRHAPILASLQQAYISVLKSTITSPYVALAVAGVFILVGVVAYSVLRPSLLPELKQTELVVAWDAAPATSRAEMNRLITQVSTELRAIAGVKNVGAHVGRAITGDQIVGINSGELWITLDPAADYTQSKAAVEEIVNGYPGLLHETENYQPTRTDEALLGPEKDIVVRVYGHDLAVLREKAQEVNTLLTGISGLAEVRTEVQAEEPQVEIEVDLAKAEKHQVKPGDVRRAASSLISGIQVGNLYQDQKVFDVVVWGKPELRSSLTNIQNLLIDTPDGQVVLKDLAEVRIVPSPSVIRRDTVSRFIDVTANVSSGSIGSVSATIQEKLKTISFPLEHHVELLDESATRAAARQRMIGFVLAALVGIFLLAQAISNKWSLAAVMLISIPMSLTGGLLAAFLTGGTLTIGSYFGLFAVLALALRHAFVMIQHFHQMEQQPGHHFGFELVLQGATERLGAIVTTTITAILALLPFIVLGNIAGHEVVRPMAIVIVGGLITSAVLNLFVMPALYLRFGHVSEPEFNDASLRTHSLQAAD